MEVNTEEIVKLVEEHHKTVEWLRELPETKQIQEVFESIKDKINEHNKGMFNQYTWGNWWDDCVDIFMQPSAYYSTSEPENALDYLETVSEALASNSQHRWKRIILGIDGALYGLAISVLGSSNPDYVVVKGKKDNSEKLIDFKKAIKEVIKTKGHLNVTTPNPLLSEEEKKAIFKLHFDFRNNFQHFKPGGWSIQMAGLPLICMRTLNPIIILGCNLHGIKNYVQYVRLINCIHQIAHLLLIEHAKVFIAERQKANNAD